MWTKQDRNWGMKWNTWWTGTYREWKRLPDLIRFGRIQSNPVRFGKWWYHDISAIFYQILIKLLSNCSEFIAISVDTTYIWKFPWKEKITKLTECFLFPWCFCLVCNEIDSFSFFVLNNFRALANYSINYSIFFYIPLFEVNYGQIWTQ